eukprot:10975502-Alexandrium_andersonii.AAC.1
MREAPERSHRSSPSRCGSSALNSGAPRRRLEGSSGDTDAGRRIVPSALREARKWGATGVRNP